MTAILGPQLLTDKLLLQTRPNKLIFFKVKHFECLPTKAFGGFYSK